MEKKKVELFTCSVEKECTNVGCVHREPHEFIHHQCSHACVKTDKPSGSSTCAPYKLQVGDRVLVLESIRGVIESRAWVTEMLEEIGKEHVVKGCSGGFVDFHGICYSWPVDHLQYIGRGEKEKTDSEIVDLAEVALKTQTSGGAVRGTIIETLGTVGTGSSWSFSGLPYSEELKPEPEYTSTGKKLPLWELIKSSEISFHELERIVTWFKRSASTNVFLRKDMFSVDGFLDYALQHFCFKDFLLEGGYIKVKEEEKKEVLYKCGDRFEYEKCEAVIVVQKGSNKMAGLVLQGGLDKNVCWSKFVPVADLDGITQEEFGKMCGASPSSCWTKQQPTTIERR